jgi:hypothetical protein
MTAYMPLGEKQAAALGLPNFSASWPVIAFAAGGIIVLALTVALVIAFAPRHGARHAHGPRHAKPETTPANGKQGIGTGVLGNGPALPPALQPFAAEARPDNSVLDRWARA